MPHVSLRVTEFEKSLMENYAKLQGANLSDAIKDVFFKKLEDEYDIKTIREYEENKAKGDVQYHSHAEVKRMLELS